MWNTNKCATQKALEKSTKYEPTLFEAPRLVSYFVDFSNPFWIANLLVFRITCGILINMQFKIVGKVNKIWTDFLWSYLVGFIFCWLFQCFLNCQIISIPYFMWNSQFKNHWTSQQNMNRLSLKLPGSVHILLTSPMIFELQIY